MDAICRALPESASLWPKAVSPHLAEKRRGPNGLVPKGTDGRLVAAGRGEKRGGWGRSHAKLDETDQRVCEATQT